MYNQYSENRNDVVGIRYETAKSILNNNNNRKKIKNEKLIVSNPYCFSGEFLQLIC